MQRSGLRLVLLLACHIQAEKCQLACDRLHAVVQRIQRVHSAREASVQESDQRPRPDELDDHPELPRQALQREGEADKAKANDGRHGGRAAGENSRNGRSQYGREEVGRRQGVPETQGQATGADIHVI